MSKQMFEVNGEAVNKKSLQVEFWYPDRDDKPTLSVGLMDVRAASNIEIEYDFEEDGYKIYMDRTKDVDSGAEVVEDKVLVAFIPSWNDKEHDEVKVDRRNK